MKQSLSSVSTSALLNSIMDGISLAASDGSFFPLSRVGACAWIISTPDGVEWIQGGGIILGEYKDQGSYKSELRGQLGISTIRNYLLLQDPIPPNRYHITTICDGLSALNTVGI